MENLDKLKVENVELNKNLPHKAKVYISPIKIFNDTGYKIIAKYYKKEIHIDENLP